MADRRRVNGPGGPTLPPLYDDEDSIVAAPRQREANSIRPVYLKTGVTPPASGSAYLEMQSGRGSSGSGMKLTCTVHGPRSLPRSAPFSPHVVLSTHVKYAPFATRQRRGYLRDWSEKDLAVHLETVLRGAIIADRWPKSGVDVIVTIIEGELSRQDSIRQGVEEWEMMNVLSGCITVASAAIADAGIDCVDTVSGGVAALVAADGAGSETLIVLDPVPLEHEKILAACCVAYLPNRDEITNLWFKGRLPSSGAGAYQTLVSRAVHASKGTQQLIKAALQEATALA
ncbi:Exosome complex component MTR3 [Escovopsis weberi]|uniref:Exosome complex component MTR3 n=1 Tax=Escovopsis weberi TaxID=150374 RepID=A0A0M9VV88_ESCWE|nr:Exosome complex component MTR3 [Escovopsis weberi]